MKSRFPKARYTEGTDAHQEAALAVFQRDWTNMPTVVLHMKGTEFQLKVWRSLLRIPLGDLTTYRRIATELDMPQAARAVGTAIGSNPIAWLVPCHRVVRTSGELGGYVWGPTRKAAIMAWESQGKHES
jgi:AraC family transcriptional regulator of adaptative response/methylated-DNA-[protein]-cysteine methyltransferase